MELTPLSAAALALLSEKAMHPYEMYRTLRKRGDDRLVKVRPGTLYRAVERLEADGLAEVVRVEQEQNRPERTVYGIRPDGRRAVLEWTSERLAAAAEEYPVFPLALALAPTLEWADARTALERRRAVLAEQVEEYRSSMAVARGLGVPESHLLEDLFQLGRL